MSTWSLLDAALAVYWFYSFSKGSGNIRYLYLVLFIWEVLFLIEDFR